MTELTAFLEMRVDEDEEAARLAAREGGTWHQEDPGRYPGSIISMGGQVIYDEGAPDEYQAAHIARHDPSRVLREIKLKRALLAQWNASPPDSPVLTFALHCMAAVYSDHPDYRAEWKP